MCRFDPISSPVRIKKSYQTNIPIDPERLIRGLLKKIPREHLLGVDSIVLVDQFSKESKPGSAGLYWQKHKNDPARIEIAINMVYKGMPRCVFYLPFISKFLLASVLFHEIGHHHKEQVHGITKQMEEIFADKYRVRMLRQSFFWWRIFLLPFSPLIFRAAKRREKAPISNQQSQQRKKRSTH